MSTTCKPAHPKPVFCAEMSAALNAETKTGLTSETLYNLADPTGPKPVFDMVAVRRRSHEKPTFLYWCPWCRASLLPKKKTKP